MHNETHQRVETVKSRASEKRARDKESTRTHRENEQERARARERERSDRDSGVDLKVNKQADIRKPATAIE